MAFQLTIARKNLPAAEALKRKKVVNLDASVATIGGDGCDCALTGVQGERATISLNANGSYTVAAAPEVYLNGQPCKVDATPLHSGDTLLTDGWVIQFHVRMESVPQSWRSAFLAIFAKTSIVLIILTVVATMFWLPNLLRSSHRWTRYATLEQLSLTLDAERRHARKVEKTEGLSTFNALLLEEVRNELDNCARHVRAHESTMSAQQHRKMLEEVLKLASLLKKIEMGQDIPPLPSPTLDQAIKTIISQRRLPGK